MIQDQVVLQHVTERFTTRTMDTVTTVDGFNLNIQEGECFPFLRPSGRGKTTTLRMIVGFEGLSEGEIHLCGKPVSIKSKNLYVLPEGRGLGTVFQAFAVWPHMNIFDNVAFPSKIQNVNKTGMTRRAKEALHHCSLGGLEEVYLSELSGGQQQRIALARVIVTSLKVMLLDEPLSNLNPKLRESMRFEIKELQRKFNFTIISVTHDQSEVMAISDRMMVCDMGRIMQVGAPANPYNKPNSRPMHSFLRESILINAVIKNKKAYPKGDVNQALDLSVPSDAANDMVAATRPGVMRITGDQGFKTRVEKRISLTDKTEYLVSVGEQPVKAETSHCVVFASGKTCCIHTADPMWYPVKDKKAQEEQLKRQLV